VSNAKVGENGYLRAVNATRSPRKWVHPITPFLVVLTEREYYSFAEDPTKLTRA